MNVSYSTDQMMFTRTFMIFFTLPFWCLVWYMERNIEEALQVKNENMFENDQAIYNYEAINLDNFNAKSQLCVASLPTYAGNLDVEDDILSRNDTICYNRKEISMDVSKSSSPKYDQTAILNYRPIIGILSQELSDYMIKKLNQWYGDKNYTSYISAAYVKYLEQAGARVIPVFVNQTEDYYETIFNSTNGLLIPGGSGGGYESGFSKAGKLLFNKVISSKTYWPIWGICRGFALLAYLSNKEERTQRICNSYQQPLPLNLTEAYFNSHFAQHTSDEVTKILSTQKVTLNNHKWCLTPENFTKFEALGNFWNVLSTNSDWDGLEFISLMEAKRYPMWASIYHPEKNSYEWCRKHTGIPHSKDAVFIAAHQANFFVDETRKNMNSFATREEEERHLIYNYHPEFTGDAKTDFSLQQLYLFTS